MRPRALPRADGVVRLSARLAGRRTTLETLYQRGSAKALLPRGLTPELTAVLLNTAGGVTGGDRFRTEAAVRSGASLTLTTQTAERAYRALPGTHGEITTALSAEAGAVLHWLPQEMILFDRSALTRQLSVDLAGDASFLAIEPVILGRTAMGETVTDLRFSDQWRVRREGRLIYADALRIRGDAAALTASAATLGGHRAFASLLLAAPRADRILAPLRDRLGASGGASLIRSGVLAARLSAPDGFALRRTLMPALELLRGAPLPRTWSL